MVDTTDSKSVAKAWGFKSLQGHQNAKYSVMIVKNEEEVQYWKIIKEIGSYNDKWEESIATKADIITNLIYSLEPDTTEILFPNFNPIALNLSKKYNVTIICDANLEEDFDFQNINRVDSVDQLNKKYDIIIALDEYFTYADSEQEQRRLLDELAGYTTGWLITTLQDYKNFAPHKKNQVDASSYNSEHNYIMLESRIANKTDKQVWDHYFYCIKDHLNLLTIGAIKRRTMYFKQLAKYSSDAGSNQYVIQKNLLYKGFFSKNFEHIITVKF